MEDPNAVGSLILSVIGILMLASVAWVILKIKKCISQTAAEQRRIAAAPPVIEKELEFKRLSKTNQDKVTALQMRRVGGAAFAVAAGGVGFLLGGPAAGIAMSVINGRAAGRTSDDVDEQLAAIRYEGSPAHQGACDHYDQKGQFCTVCGKQFYC
jgi:hypothetical protein